MEGDLGVTLEQRYQIVVFLWTVLQIAETASERDTGHCHAWCVTPEHRKPRLLNHDIYHLLPAPTCCCPFCPIVHIYLDTADTNFRVNKPSEDSWRHLIGWINDLVHCCWTSKWFSHKLILQRITWDCANIDSVKVRFYFRLLLGSCKYLI